MTDRTSLSLLKRTIPCCSFPENIVLDDIILVQDNFKKIGPSFSYVID